jgi:uridine kinase
MTMGERLVLDARHLTFARSLAELLEAKLALASASRPVIAIAGESGSGKSITATALAEVLRERGRRVVVLHQDDYFVRPPRANHDHRCVDLGSVGPQEVNLLLLAAHVAAFRAGRDATGPRVDYASDSFTTCELPLANADVLVVEGTYVFQLADADVRIFLEATHEDTAERRRLRNRDVDAPIVDQVLAIEHALIAPQVRQADIVIDREFRIRSSRSRA